MYNRKNAFTLIELMVVVAVIAILATLGVTNFSAAIKRTRNAGRQADIQAVAKALETCYDVPSGVYKTIPTTGANVTNQAIPVGGVTSGPYAAGTAANQNSCLNESIMPKVANYLYYVSYQTAQPQQWIVCAQLEKVANWGSIGNVATLPTSATAAFGAGCDDTSATCYYCVRNQQ